ncbi:MAG: four helix bundle protein [Planctomycetes bacterium]|nr:four helix bundle protein [Planctomycetota bacterium]
MPFRLPTWPRPPVAAVRGRLERAARHDANRRPGPPRPQQSIALNTAEGNGRQGRDRARHFTYAYGSARELRAVLAIAEADGQVTAADLATASILNAGRHAWAPAHLREEPGSAERSVHTQARDRSRYRNRCRCRCRVSLR